MALTKLETTSIFLGILLSGGLMLLGYDQSLSRKMQENMEKETQFLSQNNKTIKNDVNPIILDLFKNPFLDKSDYDKIFIKSDEQSPMSKAIIYGAILQSIKNRLINGTYGNQMSDRPISYEEWLNLKNVYNTTLTKLGKELASFQHTPEKFEHVIKNEGTFNKIYGNIDIPIIRINSMEALIKHYEESPEFYRQGWSGRYLNSFFSHALSVKGLLEQNSIDKVNDISSHLRKNHEIYSNNDEQNNNESYVTRSGALNITQNEWEKYYKDKFGENIIYWFKLLDPNESKKAAEIDLSNLEQITTMTNNLKVK